MNPSRLVLRRTDRGGYQLHPWIVTVIGGIVFLLIWQYSLELGLINALLMPKPTGILSEFIRVRSMIFTHLWTTLFEALVGFVSAIVLAFGLGLLFEVNQTINKTIFPLIVAGNSVPRIAVAPLVIFYLGGGEAAKFVIAAWIAFFPMLVSTVQGLRLRDDDQQNQLAVLDATSWQRLRYVQLPKALPHLFDGMKLSANLAIIGAIVGEFVAANQGIGYILLLVLLQGFQFTLAVAIVLVMGFIGLAVLLTLYVIQSRVVFWEPATFYGGRR